MIVEGAEVYAYCLPLIRPFAMRGGTLTERSGFLLKVTAQGLEGWGDAAPLPGFSAESLDECRDALLAAARSIAGKPIPDFAERAEEGRPPSAAFAIQTSCLDLRARAAGLSMAACLNPEASAGIQLCALLAGSREEILDKAGAIAPAGYGAVKIKAGARPVDEDIELIQDLRDCLGPEPALRVDANRAWDIDTALRFAHALADTGIEYIEEPLQGPGDLPAFAESSPIPYALDETLQERSGQAGPASEALWQHAAALVWKPTLAYCPALLQRLNPSGPAEGRPKTVISAAFESGVGIRALAHYAAAFSDSGPPAGLDTYAWLGEDLLEPRLTLNTPELRLDALGHSQVDTTKLRRIN